MSCATAHGLPALRGEKDGSSTSGVDVGLALRNGDVHAPANVVDGERRIHLGAGSSGVFARHTDDASKELTHVRLAGAAPVISSRLKTGESREMRESTGIISAIIDLEVGPHGAYQLCLYSYVRRRELHERRTGFGQRIILFGCASTDDDEHCQDADRVHTHAAASRNGEIFVHSIECLFPSINTQRNADRGVPAGV